VLTFQVFGSFGAVVLPSKSVQWGIRLARQILQNFPSPAVDFIPTSHSLPTLLSLLNSSLTHPTGSLVCQLTFFILFSKSQDDSAKERQRATEELQLATLAFEQYGSRRFVQTFWRFVAMDVSDLTKNIACANSY
jgi:hypothetical protein